ncbi:c-type cytochrome [Bacillus sp. EB600]|uniref:c-type cytochrome n=1 Tax=Bacillus sp. EB600 TaxID=2806345 RepID=UPI00210A1D39|nr:c-type cytochrome [Bacillus sp. EB600]MCQ6278060.1 c-type cytochrome [Bacillus sp. EB600]
MKRVLIGLYLIIIVGIIVLLVSNYFRDNKNDKAIAAGERVYKQQCAPCHGQNGKGEGSKAGTALNNQHFLNSVSDRNLYNNIKNGRTGTAMPSYGSKISKMDLENLVAFIRNWKTEEMKLSAPKIFDGNVENGAHLYQTYCLTCHGEKATGKLDMGPSLSNTEFLKYTSDKQIWISTAYGREETRMGPSLKGLDGVRQLKEEEITDIVSYIRSLQKK